MTPEEAILRIKAHMEVHKLRDPQAAYITEALNMAMTTLKEIQQYREIGTVEECKKAVNEEDALKFYYCESEDNYYIGKRVGNFYYAKYGETGCKYSEYRKGSICDLYAGRNLHTGRIY